MNSKLLIGLFIVFVLILYGCSSNAPEVESVSQQPQINFTEVRVVPSCNDDNNCTEDVFNNVTQQCDHIRQETCCGDRACDYSERCDEATHKTKCPVDCPRECPAFVQFNDWQCDGNCFDAGSYYIIEGDSTFTANLANIGEMSLNDVTSRFSCLREGLGSVFYNDRMSDQKLGVVMESYFNDRVDEIYLSGEYYGRHQADFTFEITGKPTQDTSLLCTVTLSTVDGFSYPHEFSVHLRRPV